MEKTHVRSTKKKDAFPIRTINAIKDVEINELVSKHNVNLGLGVFSLALGAGEVFLTKVFSRQSGLNEKYSSILRAFGVREMTSGLGLLRGKNEQTWLWSRVFGDALDVGFLAYAYLQEQDAEKRKKIALSAAAVAPIVALDVINVMRGEPVRRGRSNGASLASRNRTPLKASSAKKESLSKASSKSPGKKSSVKKGRGKKASR